MSNNYWTTSQAADYLACEPESIYESRRRKEWPGVLGKRRGRQLLFEREAIEQGLERLSEGLEPIPQETTENPTEAILWALEGIHTTLRAIENELRAQRGNTGGGGGGSKFNEQGGNGGSGVIVRGHVQDREANRDGRRRGMSENMTVGEVLRSVADSFDSQQDHLAWPSEKWLTMKFTARVDSNGKVWVEDEQLRETGNE